MRCAACGEDNPERNRFCGECGTRLSGAGTDGERKPVTILFCDIVGSTPLAERLGADRMHGVLNEFSEVVFPAAYAYGGSVNQFMGDGFMALFGAPVVHEDHAVRAGLAALEIRERVARRAWHQLPAGERIEVRIGLNAGVVVFGAVGDARRAEITAIGDAANVAARLQALAEPGQVVCSATVATALAGDIATRILGPRAVKGKSEPVEVHELVGRRTSRTHDAATVDDAEGVELFGRERECGLTAQALERLQTGIGGLVVVEAPAGQGKSSLLAAMRRAARGAGVAWVQGHCVSYGEGFAYLPFRDALRAALGVAGEGETAELRAALKARLEVLLPGESASLLPGMAELAGLAPDAVADERPAGLDGQAVGLQIFHSSLRVVEGLAATRPLVMVFDDWQWSDAASVALLEHLLTRAGGLPILFVVATRPGGSGRPGTFETLSAARSAAGGHCERITLSPLDDEAARRLLERALGTSEVHPTLARHVIGRCGGNPFYLEQIVRALRATDGLARDIDGRWRLASGSVSFELPDSVEGVVLAQVDRLSPAAKELLKIVAVAGDRASATLLGALAGGTEATEPVLVELLLAGLLARRDPGHQALFVFPHALVQQAVYGSLLAERRRELHGRVGDALRAAGDVDVENRHAELAHHYVCAERWLDARDHLLEAGERAARIAADAEALAQFDRALAAVQASGRALDIVGQARLRAGIAEALYRLGRNDEALGHAVAALGSLGYAMPDKRIGVRREIARTLARGSLARIAEMLRRRPTVVSDGPAFEVTARLFEVVGTIDYFRDPERFALGILRMLAEAESRPPSRSRAISTAALALICDMLRLPRAAARLHARAARLAEACGDDVARGYCCQMRGLHQYARGDWRGALPVLETGARHLEAAGHWRLWSSCVGVSYIVLRSLGDPRWLDLAERQRRMAESTGDRHAQAWAVNAEGVACLYRGDHRGALPKFERASHAYEAIPDYRFLAGALARRGLCHALDNQPERAVPLLERAESLRRRHRVGGIAATAPLMAIAEAYLVLAEHRSANIDPLWMPAAQAACYRAARHARGIGDESAAEVCRLSGIHAWLAGERARALRAWERGIAVATRSGARAVLARLHHELGARAGETHHAALARELFAATGAAPLTTAG